MTSYKPYRLLIYLGLIPFMVFTYQTWCGPIEEVRQSTRIFIVFSATTLIFLSGGWWGMSYTQPPKIQFRMMITGLVFALGSALTIAFAELPFLVIALGVAHFLIWLLEFFIPQTPIKHDYRIQRTVLTMTIVVCHMLVATQYLDY